MGQGEGERQRAGGRGSQGEGERQRAGGRGSQGEGERQRAGGEELSGAAITLQRRLDWCDTDAAARWHHSTIWRFVEAAETELHRRLGILGRTFGFTPRRRLEAEFHTALQFDDLVTIGLRVTHVGRTSATYGAELSVGSRRVASAVVVIVFTDADGRPTPWSDDIVRALRDGVAAIPPA